MSTTARTPRRHRGTAAAFLVLASALIAMPGASAGPEPAAAGGASSTRIDELVFGRLKTLGIEPATACSDETFVRRAALDLTGTLPTAAEVRAFRKDPNPDKRAAWIDRLLERDEFADYWAMRWCGLLRVKSEFPINLWPNAVQAYHRWIRTCVGENRPYDRFVREMLTASGSNFRVPQVNFWRAVESREPAALAQTVALTFMGTRAQAWPKERLEGMAAFFARVGFKSTAEWKEEIVSFDLALGKTDAPATGTFPDGTTAALSFDRDPREAFADWLVRPGNPWFARAIANRVWSWLMGTGIVHEPDDLREDNPPSNPELLAWLEREVVSARFDLKHLFRVIASSRAYQLSCVPASKDPRARASFAFYPVRRLEPEVLIDAIDRVTGTTETYTSRIPEPFTFVPTEKRSIELADASVSSPFLELFGRSPRDTGLESEQRDGVPSTPQRLHLLNSTHIRRKLEEGPGLRALRGQANKPRETVEALYLTILSRGPTAEELAEVLAYRAVSPRRNLAVDLAWALINGAEFQYRH